MAEHFDLMFAGIDSGGAPMKVTAPYDGATIAKVSTADAAAVDAALERAHALYLDRDGWLPLPRRTAILEKAARIMESRKEELAVEAAREGGKPLIDSRIEVARAIDGVKLCVEAIRTQAGTEIPMNLNPASAGRMAFTQYEPSGVVTALSAFNHPLNLIVHQVGPAVAAGCPVIVKPAEATPLSCFRFVQTLYEAGLPEEWCMAGVTESLEVAEKLVTDPRVSFLTFIGSARVGWMLRSKLAPGARCAFEHGGAAPVMVAPDADLDDVLPLLVKGGFYHAGQVCVSVQRVFAHASIAREVAERMSDAAQKLTIGDPTDANTDVGPLIRHAEVDRVHAWVREAVDGGAELLTGGSKVSDSCYQCTVLLDPPAEASVSTQEIFGPVVCVYSYQDIDDAIARANALPYSFQAAVCTRDINTALRAYKRLNASAVMINDHTAFRVDWMPFAGLKQSGYGIGGIHYTLRDMQVEKLLVIRSPEL